MTDKLKNRLKLGGVVVLALLIGGLGVAKASSFWDWNELKGLVAQKIADKVDNPVQVDSQGPSLGAVTGPALPNPFCQNGECTWTVSQTWVHASSTIFSVLDPFQQTTSTGGVVIRNDGNLNYTGASTTVDLVRIYQTAQVTSSFGIACGPSTGPTGAGLVVAKEIVTTTAAGVIAIPTSSLGVLENNMTAAQGNRASAGTVAKVMMGPSDPYFVCLTDPNLDGAAGVISGDSTGTGKIYIHFKRSQL